MDEGVGQRGCVDGPKEAFASGGPETILAASLGRGAYLFLVGPKQEAEQGLRASTRELGSFHLHSDEPPYGEEIGTLVRLFGQFLGEVHATVKVCSEPVLCH